jgi:hypothetical protein
MAYLKPPWFTVKVFNKIAMMTGLAGTETLTVTLRNVHANPTMTLTARGSARRFTGAELPVEDRPPVLAAYRAKAGRSVDGYFAKLPAAADHPVFRLTP